MVKPKLNRRISVVVTGSVQNDEGGNEPVEIARWNKWAQVENRTGRNSNPYDQQVWQYNYKVTLRRELSRPTQSNYEIEYDGKRMKVESVEIDTENFQHYEICRCSKIDTFGIASPSSLINPNMHRQSFVLPVDETSVTVSQIASMELADILSVTLDGYDYPVIIDAGNPVTDEVKVLAGVITFPYADSNNDRNGYVNYQTHFNG